jgi:hypothetical protein
VFSGGFDIESACAVTSSDDDFTTLDLLDALVRKSLLVADRASGRTRFSMLETIRQFVEEQLAARAAAMEIRTAHARHFANREGGTLALWNGPRQRETYDWFAAELANLRTAFRWSMDQRDFDSAMGIARQAGFLGCLVENYEPSAWAVDLIEPARATNDPRLVSWSAIASMCCMLGCLDEALEYTNICRTAMQHSPVEEPIGLVEGWLAAVYIFVGDLEEYVGLYRSQLAHGRDIHEFNRISLVAALSAIDRKEEARAVATGLVEAAEATRNPYILSFALLADGVARLDTDASLAREEIDRGLVIARESGNRANETYLAMALTNALDLDGAEPGDLLTALDNITLAIRHYYDAGNSTHLRNAEGQLAVFLERRGHYEPAAITLGFACVGPMPAPTVPGRDTVMAHLGDALGDQAYSSFVGKGEAMTTADAVAYAYDQIDQVRSELEKSR